MLKNTKTYAEKRVGHFQDLGDETNACVVYEFGPLDGHTLCDPICMQNGFPYSAIQGTEERYAGETFCYLETLFVDEKERGKGYGGQLLQKCLDASVQAGVKVVFIILSQEDGTVDMESWFKKKGFVLVGRLDCNTPLLMLELR